MYKIAICGKANSGKNTVSKILRSQISKKQTGIFCEYIAFADPIKAMIRLMFPDLPEKFLTGPSKFRAEPIPGAFKDGIPLTVRQLLIDLGTGVGRACKETIWLDAFDHAFQKAQGKCKNMVIVTDVRFRNEFEHLKKLGFYQIKLLRNTGERINHVSETDSNSIGIEEFDSVIYNDQTLADLKYTVSELIPYIKSK